MALSSRFGTWCVWRRRGAFAIDVPLELLELQAPRPAATKVIAAIPIPALTTDPLSFSVIASPFNSVPEIKIVTRSESGFRVSVPRRVGGDVADASAPCGHDRIG